MQVILGRGKGIFFREVPAMQEDGLLLNASWVDYTPGGDLFLVRARHRLGRKIEGVEFHRLLPIRTLATSVGDGPGLIFRQPGCCRNRRHVRQRCAVRLETMHYFWIGAIPAMVFLGIVMMPFYYGSKVRSVPEFMRRRFGSGAHLVNALSFALAQLLIAGINLLLLAKVVNSLLGGLWVTLVIAAVIVLSPISP